MGDDLAQEDLEDSLQSAQTTSDEQDQNLSLQGSVIHTPIGDIKSPKANLPVNMDYEFQPGISVNIGGQSPAQGYGISTTEKGLEGQQPGFFKSAAAEFYNLNTEAQYAHAAYEKINEPSPYDEVVPPGWNPKQSPESFYDIPQQYWSYLSDAHGPKDLEFRRNRVLGEINQDENLENGSTFGKIVGGALGLGSDVLNWIPIVNGIKYAKLSSSVFSATARIFPSALAIGTLSAGAREADKTTGNLKDFVNESAIDTLFATALFGVGGGIAGNTLEKMNLWDLRRLSLPFLKGVDYKLATDDKGVITGVKAFDATGSAGAAEVSKAQEMADQSFLKSGFFKIPYVGQGLLTLKGLPVIGSPQIHMANSPYATVRSFIGLAADTAYITHGIEAGKEAPRTFESLMQQEFAELKGISAQMNTLHLERNGFNIKNRPLQDLVNAGMGLKNFTLKKLGADLDNSSWISRDDFDDEVQQVLHSGESSEHSSVNQAAAICRKKMDDVITNYNRAFGKSETINSPLMSPEYLMRVYNTPYLNVNKFGVNGFVPIISDYFKKADQVISNRMKPIDDLKSQLDDMKSNHEELIRRPNVTDDEVKLSSDAIEKKRIDLKVAQENLQNELRDNPEYKYHVEDHYALSADEAKELEGILKPLNDIKAQISDQQKIVTSLKNQQSKAKQSSIKGKTAKTAKKHAENKDVLEKQIKQEESKLAELKGKQQDEEHSLYERTRNGEIDSKFYYPETHQLKDPNVRLKFRDVFENDIERENYAEAAYNSILHTNPEDMIASIMGRVGGNSKENHLKARTLPVPDKILYDNNFMTKNLMSKLNNYVLYVSRRTHLKNVFKNVTHEGGIEPLIENLKNEYDTRRLPFETKKTNLQAKLKTTEDAVKKAKIEKSISKLEKQLNKERKLLNSSEEYMKNAYERMMGLRKRERWEVVTQGIIRSLIAMINLHWLPVTQIADIGAHGMQHGVWPFIRDGIYPILESLNGILKTKDSEALREAAPHVHLGLQDVLNVHADKTLAQETQPYVNMGPVLSGVENLAHYSGNIDLTNYIDNWNQRLAGSVIQSQFMKNLVDFAKGKASKNQVEYLLKYGIDPKEWAERMVKAFKDAEGFKTKLGGYQSRFYQWQDLEASNKFSDAVFKGIKNTIIQRGMFDSPFWADNLLGMIFHTFTGWGYASINRYLLPILQRPDAEKLLGVLVALGFGSLVSPMRRMIRGEQAVPDDMTDGQRFYETVSDSAVASALTNVLSYANFLTGDKLIGNLKNDKFRNRVGIGASSAVFGTANRMYNILNSFASGQMNQKDLMDASRMLPFFGTLYGYQMSKMMIDNLGLPATRAAAGAE